MDIRDADLDIAGTWRMWLTTVHIGRSRFGVHPVKWSVIPGCNQDPKVRRLNGKYANGVLELSPRFCWSKPFEVKQLIAVRFDERPGLVRDMDAHQSVSELKKWLGFVVLTKRSD